MINNRYTLQGCQNAPATGAITGYFKAFCPLQILGKKPKKWTIKTVIPKKKKRNCFNHDLYILFCAAPYLPGKHIFLVVCVPLPGKHISSVICVPPPGKHISLVICVPPPGKHISLVVCVPYLGNTYPQ